MTGKIVTSWQIDGDNEGTVSDFIFLASKINVDSDCSHKMKRYLLLGRIAMTNLEKCIKKQRHHFADKGLCDQSSGFSSSHVCMWELDYKESWVPKNWCFWTVVLEKMFECRLDCKEIQAVNPKGNNPECSLEGLMLKLKLQYFGHLMQRADSFEKTLTLGQIEGERRRGWQKMRWVNGIIDLMDMSLSKLQLLVMDRET